MWSKAIQPYFLRVACCTSRYVCFNQEDDDLRIRHSISGIRLKGNRSWHLHDCLTRFDLLAQVITGRNIKGQPGKLMSIATKVMIQVASKLGAEPWRVAVPQTVTFLDRDVCFLNS
jgi:hypothetical protein